MWQTFAGGVYTVPISADQDNSIEQADPTHDGEKRRNFQDPD
jgi:hypothetical protein